MASFSPDVVAILPEPMRTQQMPRAKAMVDLLVELAPSETPRNDAWDESKARYLVTQLRPALLEIDALQQRSDCVFSVSHEMQQRVPHLQTARWLARLGRLEARMLDPATDFDALRRSVNRSFRLTLDIGRRGLVLAQTVGFVVDIAALSSIEEFLVRRPALSADQCREFAVIIQRHEAARVDATAEAARGDYIMCGNILWGLEHGTLKPEDFKGENLDPAMARAIDYDAEWAVLNELFRFVLEEYVRTPYHQIVERNTYREKFESMRETASMTRTATFAKTGKLPGAPLCFSSFRHLTSPEKVPLATSFA